jgi:hypothetical protein
MAQTLEKPVALCPLCSEEIDLDIPASRFSAAYRDLLADREKLVVLSRLFHEKRSLDGAARMVSISSERAARLLNFLSVELCGCRTVTCVSCLDDYRSEL